MRVREARGARRLREPADRRRRHRAPAAAVRLRGPLLDGRRPGRPHLLGAPQPVRRRRAPAPRGRPVLLGPRLRALRPGDGQEGGRSRPVSDLGGRFTASFLKPALCGTPQRLPPRRHRAPARSTESYTSRLVDGTARPALPLHRHVLGPGRARGRARAVERLARPDRLHARRPAALGHLRFDRQPARPDPRRPRSPRRSRPIRNSSAPTPASSSRARQASTYYALDEDARYVLAGRLGVGSITGADLDEIPANRRFYAGGGGSVRGYEYRSLSPARRLRRADRRPQPDRGLPRGAHQGDRHDRHRALRRCRHAPSSRAFRISTSRSGSPPAWGLRYYTAIGPIRLDVACRSTRATGDPRGRVLYQPGAGLLMRRRSPHPRLRGRPRGPGPRAPRHHGRRPGAERDHGARQPDLAGALDPDHPRVDRRRRRGAVLGRDDPQRRRSPTATASGCASTGPG